MSTQPTVDLAGYNIKEWSLIILMIGLMIVFIVFGIGLAVAITNSPTVVISGEIDLGQFTGVIIGIAMVAVVLVSQQLTAKTQASATAQSDAAWSTNP